MIILRKSTCILLCGLLLASAGCATTTRVNSTPEGATIYIDGELLGTTPFIHHDRGSLPKRHRMQVVLDGYQTEEFYIDRELALIYAALTSVAYGVPLLWAWWMPDRMMITLRPIGADAAPEESVTPAEPPPPEPVAPPSPPPPAAEPVMPPPPPAAEPEPLTPPPSDTTLGDEGDEDEDDLVPPPPPPPLD